MENKQINSYIEENRGYITASKLKEFMKSPEQFFLKYIKEMPSQKDSDERHFILWTALDDYISYWELEFHKKYFIDEWLTISDMTERLTANWTDPIVLKWLKAWELKELLYWDISSKIRLTAWEWETILWCVREFNRQSLFNKNWWYETQKTFIWAYKSLKLKWTLDRYKTGELRDTKTCANIWKFIWEWKDILWYDVSMAFYWVLVWKATWDKPKTILDVVQKTFPFPSRSYEIPNEHIFWIVENTIIPALETLDAMMIARNETKNEDLWKVRQRDFSKLIQCDMYPIMESAIQETFEILQ